MMLEIRSILERDFGHTFATWNYKFWFLPNDDLTKSNIKEAVLSFLPEDWKIKSLAIFELEGEEFFIKVCYSGNTWYSWNGMYKEWE